MARARKTVVAELELEQPAQTPVKPGLHIEIVPDTAGMFSVRAAIDGEPLYDANHVPVGLLLFHFRRLAGRAFEVLVRRSMQLALGAAAQRMKRQ